MAAKKTLGAALEGIIDYQRREEERVLRDNYRAESDKMPLYEKLPDEITEGSKAVYKALKDFKALCKNHGVSCRDRVNDMIGATFETHNLVTLLPAKARADAEITYRKSLTEITQKYNSCRAEMLIADTFEKKKAILQKFGIILGD